MRVILSKDRAAQCDLLLQSLERHWPQGRTRILWRASDGRHERAYLDLIDEWFLHRPAWLFENEDSTRGFQTVIEFYLSLPDTTFTFLCDDDVLYGSVDGAEESLLLEPRLICFSLRLGRNTSVQYPSDLPQRVPQKNVWQWQQADLDFAYPGSIDGHIFGREDLIAMLTGSVIPNPTALECALVAGCERLAGHRPLMASFERSVLVGNPVNRVSEQSNVRHGADWPASAEYLLSQFEQGRRLDLDAIDFSRVNGAHTELELAWR